MSVPNDDRCTRYDDQTLAQLESLSWVVRVNETDRDDATHEVVTEQSVVRYDYEIHTIENLGATVTAISQAGHYGCRVYVWTHT